MDEVFECDECGREFDSARGLSIHQRVHETTDEPAKEKLEKEQTESVYIKHN
jgi:hypothetical protein